MLFNNVNCQFKDTCINGLSQTKCNNCSRNFGLLNDYYESMTFNMLTKQEDKNKEELYK